MLLIEVADSNVNLRPILLYLLISLWLYWLWTRRRYYLMAFKMPGYWGLPVFGSLLAIGNFGNFMTVMSKYFANLKEQTFCLWLGFYPCILTMDPVLIERILLSPDILDKAKPLYTGLNRALEGGLLTSDGQEWTPHRKLLNPAFEHKVLIRFFPIFNKTKNLTIRKIGLLVGKGEHKLAQIFERLSLGLTVETMMGKEMGIDEEIDEDITNCCFKAMKKIIMQLPFAVLHLEDLHYYLSKMEQIKDTLESFIVNLIKQRHNKSLKDEAKSSAETTVDHGTSMKKPGKIFIDQLISNYFKQNFSSHDLLSESATVITSSFETTASAIFSTLVMLATHSDVQERLYEELVNVFPQKEFQMEFSDLSQLPYLERVINETLRVAPPVPLIGRQLTKDMMLKKDLVLPKNLQILISTFDLFRIKDIWGEKADRFDPDHFLPENLEKVQALYHSAFIPFGKGARMCIGWRYATFVVSVMVAGLIRNYKFTTTTKYEDLKYVNYISLKYWNEPAFEINQRV